MGGENAPGIASASWFQGSSPRGRGKHVREAKVQDSLGLIPAWAGKTIEIGVAVSAARAHPRVGGENRDGDRDALTLHGSSPRGRGKLLEADFQMTYNRLIPAWAGKTRTRRPGSTGTGAHPRVGGENSHHQHTGRSPMGSSPRGRGKPIPDW